MAESCEHGNKPSTSIKVGKFDSCGLIVQPPHVPCMAETSITYLCSAQGFEPYYLRTEGTAQYYSEDKRHQDLITKTETLLLSVLIWFI